MIKPSFSQTGHRNRLDSVHSPTQPLPTFNLMVVYLILRLLLTRHTVVGAKWGGEAGGFVCCCSLSAEPGNTFDKIKSAWSKVKTASVSVEQWLVSSLRWWTRWTENTVASRQSIHPSTHYKSTPVTGWKSIPADTWCEAGNSMDRSAHDNCE